MDTFKISLVAARVNANLTQTDVANIMGVSKQTIINWEKGKIKLKPAQLKMLLDIYKISQDNIFLP